MPRTTRSILPGHDTLAFISDVAEVVALRSMLMGSGGRAGVAEAQSMVSEKVAALAHINWQLVNGSYGFTPRSMARGVFNHYAGIVRANRKRLSRSR